MFSSKAFKAILLFLLAFQLYGVSAKPAYSMASKRSPSRSSLAKSSEVEYSTNARRMAAGLNPMSPTRRFDASRIRARDPQASPVSFVQDSPYLLQLLIHMV